MSKIQIKNTQIKSLSLKNEQIASDAAISLSKIDGGVELQTAVSDLQNDAFVTREVPSGAVDGSNVTFTLANAPVAGSEQVYLNGLLQDPGAGNSYTISGGTITLASAPLSGDEIHVSYATGDYMVAPGGSGGGGASNLNGLTDVVISSPTTDQVLKYDGSQWVNGVVSSGSVLKYVSPQFNHPVLSGTQSVVYTITHNFNTTPENLFVYCQAFDGGFWKQLRGGYATDGSSFYSWIDPTFINNNQITVRVYRFNASGTMPIRFIVRYW